MKRAVLAILFALAVVACGNGSTGSAPIEPVSIGPEPTPAGSFSFAPQQVAGAGHDALPPIGPAPQVCPTIGPPPNCQMTACPPDMKCSPYYTCSGGVLWCCDAKPACAPGDVQLSQSSCPSEIPCYQKDLCGMQIACLDTKRLKPGAKQEDAGAEDAGND